MKTSRSVSGRSILLLVVCPALPAPPGPGADFETAVMQAVEERMQLQ